MAENAPKKSWKTSTVGILLIVSALATAGVALLDNDPETSVNVQTLIAAVVQALAGAGFIVAKDSKA